MRLPTPRAQPERGYKAAVFCCQPTEVPEVRCMRNYIRSSVPPSTEDYSQASQYSDAVACAEEIRDWSASFSSQVRGRLTTYEEASVTHANKINECNGLQGDYERGFCAYRSNLLHVCRELDRCYGHAQALYSSTIDLILQSNETRFRSFLVAKKVVCYINVLVRNLTIAAIYECDNKQIDTSELNFTVPPLPAKDSCDVSLVSLFPCSNAWILNKYTSKSWYVAGTVENTQCQPCEVTTTTATTTTTVLTQVSTLAAANEGLCATTPVSQSNLKCIGLFVPTIYGGSQAGVLLGTNRTGVEVFGSIGAPREAYTFCAKMDNTSVKCWGQNRNGALGLGDNDDRGASAAEMGDNLPVLDLGTNLTILKVVLGDWHACALLSVGKMKCWGSNTYFQLGRPDRFQDLGDQPGEMGDALEFVDFGPNASEVVDIGAAGYTSCALFKNTSLACWGFNGPLGQSGMLGRGISTDDFFADPQLVDLGAERHAVQLAMGYAHICVLLNTSKVLCWGSDQSGQLGIASTGNIGDEPGEMGNSLTTVAVDDAKYITAGSYHTCVILKNNSVTCWGRNAESQSGPSGSPFGSLIQLNDGTGQNVNATELACGYTFSCARLTDESIYCWGGGTVFNEYQTLNP
eukprot:s2648_g1.t1